MPKQKPLPPKRSSFLCRLLEGFGSKRSGVAQRSSAAPTGANEHRPFQAIAIYRGVRACDPAKKFSEHRFLARDAPPLPLSGCTMGSTCECRYLKYKDRRGNQRRLVDFGAPARMFSGEDRRKRNGRRGSD
jgi:hypothetical protein